MGQKFARLSDVVLLFCMTTDDHFDFFLHNIHTKYKLMLLRSTKTKYSVSVKQRGEPFWDTSLPPVTPHCPNPKWSTGSWNRSNLRLLDPLINFPISRPSGGRLATTLVATKNDILYFSLFCQAQPELQLCWAELALISSNTPTHPPPPPPIQTRSEACMQVSSNQVIK